MRSSSTCKNGINHWNPGPYAPHGVAIEERGHRDIHTILRAMGAQENWDQYVSTATFILNTRYHTGISMTPFRAMFGRDALTLRLWPPYSISLAPKPWRR
jgi:hypothetical protein